MTHAGEPVSIFRFGDFMFDHTRRLLLRGGMECHLSPKAQRLLYLLISARPRVLSREELYDELWPSTFVCETNLASIVNEVRRALHDDARASRYIRTVHGFGYAFCGQIATPAAAELQAAVLVCHGEAHSLQEGENVVGRSADSRVVIADRTISRRHAVVTVRGRQLSVHDLDSKNGTYVDGHRIGRSPVAITPTSLIHLGLVAVTVEHCKLSSTASFPLDMTDLKRQVAERLGRRSSADV